MGEVDLAVLWSLLHKAARVMSYAGLIRVCKTAGKCHALY